MTDLGESVRKASKGPADAVIRQVSEAEADAAFEGGESGPVGTLADRNAGKAMPTTGIRLVSPGGPNATTEPDSRAAANLAARRARAAGARKVANAPPARQQSPPTPPPMEDWEVAVAAELAKGQRPAAPEPALAPVAPVAPYGKVDLGAPGDLLERARRRALVVLAGLPVGCELFVGAGVGPEGVELVMGLGFLIARGQAAYRGDGHYRITEQGKLAYIELG